MPQRGGGAGVGAEGVLHPFDFPGAFDSRLSFHISAVKPSIAAAAATTAAAYAHTHTVAVCCNSTLLKCEASCHPTSIVGCECVCVMQARCCALYKLAALLCLLCLYLVWWLSYLHANCAHPRRFLSPSRLVRKHTTHSHVLPGHAHTRAAIEGLQLSGWLRMCSPLPHFRATRCMHQQ